jgi:hypothetical protein
LQWVRGDATKAENAFVRINQQAATITPQELELIKNRRKPATIAARAIIRRGTGHKYWESFQDKQQNQIKEVATEVHSLIFHPTLRYPIKTLDLPAGGDVYAATALRMVYDFIILCVGAPSPDDDQDGKRTVECLQRTLKVMKLLLSNDRSSLGLHPAIYFYSWTGNQQPILFLTITSLIVDLERAKRLDSFIEVRKDFEEFLMANRPLLNQVIRKFGTKASGTNHLYTFYSDILNLLWRSTPRDNVASELEKDPKYSYLQSAEAPYGGVSPTRYSTQVKSGLVMRELLATAKKCGICNGVIPSQAISIDHKERKEDGGASTVENAQMTHPYCNTGYKEGKHAKTKASDA